MPEARRKKQPFPFRDPGVSDNAPIRVKRMVKPECPIDSTPELKQRDGTYKPNPNYTGEANCQQAYKLNSQGVWDVAKCESLGHDPWHIRIRKTMVREVVDPETGEITESKPFSVLERRLNVIQVSLNQRHTSGTELLLAKARGCLTLEEYGKRFPDEDYEDPCDFRSCNQPVTIETRFGNYCSERHARLVAADARRIFVHLRNPRDPDEGLQDQRMEENAAQIEAINLQAKAR